jgi:hypothetical protein
LHAVCCTPHTACSYLLASAVIWIHLLGHPPPAIVVFLHHEKPPPPSCTTACMSAVTKAAPRTSLRCSGPQDRGQYISCSCSIRSSMLLVPATAPAAAAAAAAAVKALAGGRATPTSSCCLLPFPIYLQLPRQPAGILPAPAYSVQLLTDLLLNDRLLYLLLTSDPVSVHPTLSSQRISSQRTPACLRHCSITDAHSTLTDNARALSPSKTHRCHCGGASPAPSRAPASGPLAGRPSRGGTQESAAWPSCQSASTPAASRSPPARLRSSAT